MRAGRAVDSDEAANALSLFEDVDLACLHRSVHVQEMLGDREARISSPSPPCIRASPFATLGMNPLPILTASSFLLADVTVIYGIHGLIQVEVAGCRTHAHRG